MHSVKRDRQPPESLGEDAIRDLWAKQITDLLVGHGYPPDEVDSFWDVALWPFHRESVRELWNTGQYRRVFTMLRAAYEVTEEVSRRLNADPEHQALIKARLEELAELYGS